MHVHGCVVLKPCACLSTSREPPLEKSSDPDLGHCNSIAILDTSAEMISRNSTVLYSRYINTSCSPFLSQLGPSSYCSTQLAFNQTSLLWQLQPRQYVISTCRRYLFAQATGLLHSEVLCYIGMVQGDLQSPK